MAIEFESNQDNKQQESLQTQENILAEKEKIKCESRYGYCGNDYRKSGSCFSGICDCVFHRDAHQCNRQFHGACIV